MIRRVIFHISTTYSKNIKQYTTNVSRLQVENFPIEEIANNINIKIDRLETALKKNTNLYKTHKLQWIECFKILNEQGFKSNNCLNMVSIYPQLLRKKENELRQSIENWRACQFGEESVLKLLSTHPYLIEVTEKDINKRVSYLQSVISSKSKIKQLIEMNPSIMFTRWDNILKNIDYIVNVMKIDINEIYRTKALQMPLNELKCRHIFLVRLGLFKPRNPKLNPSIPNPNPKLTQITDTDDVIFVKKVAQVSLEEFRVFQQLFAQERDDIENDLDDE